MDNALEFIRNNISVFDLVVVLITIYSMAQCTTKGFTISLLSFSKWLIALVITIVLVPKLSPWVEDYIESKFVADIGLGIFIYMWIKPVQQGKDTNTNNIAFKNPKN